jgi:hypothetical protein
MVMTNAGFDGTVNEAQYAAMWAVGGKDGVDSQAAWLVTAGTGRQVAVAAQSGWAFAKGVASRESVGLTLNLSTPTNGQYFLIARHIDWTSNAVTLVALAGPTTTTTTPTAAPYDLSGVVGRVTTPGSVYDQPLAWAWVNSANTTVTIFDLRLFGDRVYGTPTAGASFTFTAVSNKLSKRDGVIIYNLAGVYAASPSNGSVVATLPLGFRPPGSQIVYGYGAAVVGVAFNPVTFRVDGSNGNVQIYGIPAGTIADVVGFIVFPEQ